MNRPHKIDNGRKRLSTLWDSVIGQPQLNPMKPKPRSGKGMTELHRAVISADHRRLEELLQQHPSPPRQPSILTLSGRHVSLDINDRDELGRTALHWAVALKDPKSVEILSGDPLINYQLRDKDGRTPLHDAAIRGWYEGISTLLPKYEVNGTSPESLGLGIKDNGGRTALHWSVEYGHFQIVEELANKDPWKPDPDGNTVLHRAAQRGHKKVVEIFLKKLVDIHGPKNSAGKTPFDVAAENGQEKIAWLCFREPKLQPQHESAALSLIQNYPSLKNKNQLFFWAIKAGYTEVVQALLERRADFENRDLSKRTPLSYAAENGHEAIVQLLLEKDADVNAEDISKWTPLLYAAEKGSAAVVQILLDKGANVNAQGGYYGNALQAASRGGHDKVVQILLDRGANVYAQGGYHGNALQAASNMGYDKVVQMLLDRGANVNAQGGHYGNALQAASNMGYDKVVQMLLDRGANVNAQGGHYGYALKAAVLGGHDKVVQILRKKIDEVNKARRESGNALQAAPSEGYDEAVQEST